MTVIGWAEGYPTKPHANNCLGKNFVNHMSMDIGQSPFQSVVIIRKALMVQPHQMKNGGIEIIDARLSLHTLKTKVITLAVTVSLLDSSACKETGERIGIMIPSRSITL